jgi:hypothetical protein
MLTAQEPEELEGREVSREEAVVEPAADSIQAVPEEMVPPVK